jgi:hypothetical protein
MLRSPTFQVEPEVDSIYATVLSTGDQAMRSPCGFSTRIMPCSATLQALAGTTCRSDTLKVGMGVEVAAGDPPPRIVQAETTPRKPRKNMDNKKTLVKRITSTIFTKNAVTSDIMSNYKST